MKITKFLTLLALFLVGLQANAQNVTVRKSTGAPIAAVPEGDTEYDTFFKEGGFATWRHNQLNLTLTTSDETTLTANGQLANPANNICESTTADALCLGKGNKMQTYLTFSLPKGYSFTGYEIVWARNLRDFGTGTENYNDGYAIFGETDKSFEYKSGYYGEQQYNATAANMTIKREDPEMGNVLYFRLNSRNNDGDRVAITLKSIVLYFTAEADYSPLTPANLIASPVSAVDIPFPTGKVDYGPLESRHYNGVDRVSYSSANVVDLPANFTLYEAESIEDGTHFDGTSGKVVKYQAGTISSEGSFFKAGRPTVEGQEATEQIYYIETPTYVTLPDAEDTKNPVGFRIVGARIDYTFGESHAAGQQEVQVPHYTSYPTFYISASVETFTRNWVRTGLISGYWNYTSEGTKTYYLKSDADFTENAAQKALWFIDGDGYIRLASNPDRYLKNQSVNYTNDRLAVVGPGDRPAKYAINGEGQITLAANNNIYLCLNIDVWDDRYAHGTPNYFQMINNGAFKATRTLSGSNKTITTYTSETVDVPAFTPSEFTINLYDKTGKNVVDTKTVTSETEDGYLFVDNLNNDAVKIGIVGVGLFKGTLTLQALDPYIDQMEVVCSDQDKPGIRMSQPFFASDFSVSGGEFNFYMPSDCKGDDVKISYENLWSHYADDTYKRIDDSEPGNSRFNFVNSEHYNQFTGDNLYNNRDEAAAGKDDVKERQIVETVGTARFHFNNADVVGVNGGTVTEYPFTQANYQAAPNNGSFETLILTVPETGVDTGTSYVFTTDETRYNIAPTTAVQHRAYAFYEMKINVETTSYDPKVEIVKVYDNTDYQKSDSEIDANDAFYGAIITAPYGTAPNVKAGFASDYQIEAAIAQVIEDKEDDFNHTDIPSSVKQILYLDLSGLAGFYTNSKAAKTINAYRNTEMATNSLVFMPKGVAINDINFAYMTEGEGFRATDNIVLTDKQPFFSPYEIQLTSSKFATYTRKITRPENGQVKNATLMLPFGLSIDEESRHANEDGECVFTVNELKGGKSLTLEDGSRVNYGVAYFQPITPNDKGMTEANVPYMVKVESFASGEASFVASQKAAVIAKTPNANFVKTLDPVTMTSGHKLTNEATYSGKMYQRSVSENVFYFANDKFLDLHTLVDYKPTLYVYPFRSVYTYTGGGANNMLRWLDISYDEDPTDGIMQMPVNADLMVRSGNGVLQIEAQRGQTVTVRSLDGMTVNTVSLNAGDSKTINLPSGVYVVNNVKIIVK